MDSRRYYIYNKPTTKDIVDKINSDKINHFESAFSSNHTTSRVTLSFYLFRAKNKIESCTKLPNLEDVSTRNTFIKDRFSKRQSCKDYWTNQYAEDQFYKSQTPVFSGNLNREISLENKTQNDQKVLTIWSSNYNLLN